RRRARRVWRGRGRLGDAREDLRDAEAVRRRRPRLRPARRPAARPRRRASRPRRRDAPPRRRGRPGVMDVLRRLLDTPERTVAGLMSGTSLDGIDVAIARIGGSGRTLRVETLACRHTPYAADLRAVLLRNV